VVNGTWSTAKAGDRPKAARQFLFRTAHTTAPRSRSSSRRANIPFVEIRWPEVSRGPHIIKTFFASFVGPETRSVAGVRVLAASAGRRTNRGAERDCSAIRRQLYVKALKGVSVSRATAPPGWILRQQSAWRFGYPWIGTSRSSSAMVRAAPSKGFMTTPMVRVGDLGKAGADRRRYGRRERFSHGAQRLAPSEATCAEAGAPCLTRTTSFVDITHSA